MFRFELSRCSSKKAIDLYMSPEAWPVGVLVKRFFKPRNWISTVLLCVHLIVALLRIRGLRYFACVNALIFFLFLQEHWLLPDELDVLIIFTQIFMV